MAQTQDALSSFATAMAEYAEHLRSHTSAIQGLAEASHELKRGAADQNKVLGSIADALQQRKPLHEEVLPPEKPAAPVPAKGKYPPGCVRSRQQVGTGRDVFGAG